MSNDLWRWADPNGQQRKVRLDELRAALAGGLIAPNTPVWRAGWAGWQPAHEVPELTSASLGGANGVVLNIPPPPLEMIAVQQEYEASAGPAPSAAGEVEPPPPPAYVPIPAKAPSIHPSSNHLKTQVGGSAHVPAAPAIPTGLAPSGGVASVPPPAPASAPRLGPSLPTAIGIPPPPELVNAVLKEQEKNAPPLPMTPVMEVSSSMLVDTSSAPMSGASVEGQPPPTNPVVHDLTQPEAPEDEAELAGLPRRPGLSALLDEIALIRQGKPPKNKLLIAVVGVLALSILIMLIAGIASLFSSSDKSASKDKTKSSPSATSPTASATPPATTSAPPPERIVAPTPTPTTTPAAEEPTGPMFEACTVSGDARTIAPRAQIISGIEAQAVGSALAIGFAPGPRDAVATALDPNTLAPTSTARAKVFGGDARRVTPIFANNKIMAIADVDKKGDKLAGRRVISGGPLVDVGQSDGGIAWAPHGKDSLAKLFTADGDGALEALRGVHLTDRKGIAFAFRRGNAIHIGVAKGDATLEAEGELSTVSGLGQVGSPAITASGDRVIVAWADREGADADWGIRFAQVKIGGAASEAKAFTIPEGGLGGQAMSPSLASLGGGRFLLAWTEGPVSNHQVRAQIIGVDGSPSGSPLSISAQGVNAGQPAAAIAPNGRGVVAFLAAKGKGLEVHATAIRCSPK